MNRLGGIVRIAVASAFALGCGDPPICESDIFLAIQTSEVSSDADTVTAGVQADVRVRTSVDEGEQVTLEIFTAGNQPAGTATATVDATGVAILRVTLPSPAARLRASVDVFCGDATDELTIPVASTPSCLLTFAPAPEDNTFFAPARVYNSLTDPDPVTPGYQAKIVVNTTPGSTVEIFENADTTDQSLGAVESGVTGIVEIDRTLADGTFSYRALCTRNTAAAISTASAVVVDTTPPTCGFAVPSPGTTINASFDDNHDLTDGIQLIVSGQVIGTDVENEPTTLAIGVVGDVPTQVPSTNADANGRADGSVTLNPPATPAVFAFTFTARDHARNSCTTTETFDVTFDDDLTVAFAPPAADGRIGRSDGTVVGNTTTFPLCGTVSSTGATVTVSVDGGAPITATVTGTDWCATISLSESPPSHTLVANATAGSSSGTATLVLAVDLTPPPPPTNFLATPIHRHSIRLAWGSPSDNGARVAGYIAKVSTTPLTNANFDSTGTVLPTSTPLAPGSTETVDFDTARLGTNYFVGVATLDDAGNRSTATIAGPITTALDRTGGITAPDQTLGSLRLGAAVASGRFNDDDFDDVAVSAPTQSAGGANSNAGAVYVYFGSASGISATPSAIITSTTANGRFGSGLAAVRWSSTTRDDLVVGAPNLDTHGRIAIFRGGATFVAGPRAATTAEVAITVNATLPGFFATSSLGSSLRSADVDGDGTIDLVASAPTGNANRGGIAIFYGNTVTTNTTISDLDTTGINGAIVELFVDPGPAPNRRLGTYLHNVGPTAGPLDITDDLLVVYADDATTTTDSLFVLRSDGTRPMLPGVTARPFVADRDVRLEYITASTTTEFGAQASSLADIDGDGAREIVVAAHRNNGDRGQVLVLSGDFLGTGGAARTDDATLVLTTLNGGNGAWLGGLVLANDTVSDFDNDNLDDLLVVGRQGGNTTAFLWFGGTLPTGATTTASASLSFAAPSTFRIGIVTRSGSLGTATWAGDLDADGAVDICWGSPVNNTDDGSFEVFD